MIGARPGFYLVRRSDRTRYYIAAEVDCNAWRRVCDRALTDDDYHYWIDYSSGLDTAGRVQWAGWDRTDWFMDADMRACA